jgi:hypothetical protein
MAHNRTVDIVQKMLEFRLLSAVEIRAARGETRLPVIGLVSLCTCPTVSTAMDTFPVH